MNKGSLKKILDRAKNSKASALKVSDAEKRKANGVINRLRKQIRKSNEDKFEKDVLNKLKDI